jgi:ABC-type lipoprotein release transport system permease subunit
MRSSTMYGVALLVLGVILGWWLANRPLNELDDAVRARLDNLEANLPSSVPLLAVLLIVVFVALLVRG